MLNNNHLFQSFVTPPKKRNFFGPILLVVVLAVLVLGSVGLLKFYKSSNQRPNASLSSTALGIIKTAQEAISVAPDLLGYARPQTFLVLFLNNTEIRPGGGFIGSYAIIRTNQGQVEIVETNGSENLDWAAPKDFIITPPLPISLYMKQPRWFFRDSNWSPDFSISARTALWFYRFEGGKEGDKIDGVIGLTPTVVEKMMEITGPLIVSEKKFTADNFTEELEYHVEYGFQDTGIEVAARKNIIGDLSRELLRRVTSLPPWKWADIWNTTLSLLQEKQIMIFSNNSDLQNILERNGWAGKIKATEGDYLLVTDSNLASLKTDPTVKRSLVYKIRSEGENLIAQVAITYDHQGNFDWRTTRYRTYTKIYAPQGAKLLKADGFMDVNKKPVAPATGEELGKTFWGGFLSLEPQTKKVLRLEYVLPMKIKEQAQQGLYTLFVQKELGTISHALTVDLDFGKTNGAGKFYQETDLRVDREFSVK